MKLGHFFVAQMMLLLIAIFLCEDLSMDMADAPWYIMVILAAQVILMVMTVFRFQCTNADD